MSDDTYDAGMRVRRDVLGDEHVDRAIQRTTDLTAPFQDFITRCVWGRRPPAELVRTAGRPAGQR